MHFQTSANFLPFLLLGSLVGSGCTLSEPETREVETDGAPDPLPGDDTSNPDSSDMVTGAGGIPASGGAEGSLPSGGSATGGADMGSGGSASGSGGAPTVEPCSLAESGPLASTSNGQIIENLRVESTSGDAISITHHGVVVRNVWVQHAGGLGIAIKGAADVTLENVHVRYASAPASGANASSSHNNIECNGSPGLRVQNAKLEQGSSGIYLVNCDDSHLQFIEGHDFRGPFPRGQLVQWNSSDRGMLEDFSCVNPPGSWPEDNVNVYKSNDATIRRGFIDGNNSPSGVGVIFDGGTSTGLVEDVDAVRMGNGCFSAYAGENDVTFRRTRCRSNICESQDGRGAPKSNALMWAGSPDLSELRIEDSSYWDSCNGNLVWPAASFELVELEEVDYTERAPLALTFCWE